jgi:hypothetical protein
MGFKDILAHMDFVAVIITVCTVMIIVPVCILAGYVKKLIDKLEGKNENL